MIELEDLKNQGEGIGQKAGEIREKIASLIEGKDRLTSEIWDYIFETRENVLAYFEVKGIEEGNWQNCSWMIKNGYQFFYYQVVRRTIRERPESRFTSWNEFKRWMGEEIEETIDWDKIFASSATVREYLKEEGLEDQNWQNSTWLQKNKYNKLYFQAVGATTQKRPKARFNSWDEFLLWMEEVVVEKTNWDEVFSSKEKVREYLKKEKIEDKNWQNCSWLAKNGHLAFYQQVVLSTIKSRPNKRFNSWEDFLIWMEKKADWEGILKSPEKVREYLKKEKIEDKNWRSSSWLANNGYLAFYVQAVNATTKERTEPRFESWEDFLLWTGEEVEEKTNWDQVFDSKENVQRYLQKNKIEDKDWQTSTWLTNNGYGSFYQQAVRATTKDRPSKRFNSWDEFLEWMGEEPSTDWDQVFASSENVKEYLKKEGIEDQNWHIGNWLVKNQYSKFYSQVIQAITQKRPKPRFESWNDFLVWIGEREAEEQIPVSNEILHEIREGIKDEF